MAKYDNIHSFWLCLRVPATVITETKRANVSWRIGLLGTETGS